MTALRQITHALGNVLSTYFTLDMDVMSPEARKIFSNKEDRKMYVEAVEELRNTKDTQKTITLSNKQEITLIS